MSETCKVAGVCHALQMLSFLSCLDEHVGWEAGKNVSQGGSVVAVLGC